MSEPTTPAPTPRGKVWEIKAKDFAVVTRPDGTDARVLAVRGIAGYVLDVAGEFSAEADGNGKRLKVTAA